MPTLSPLRLLLWFYHESRACACGRVLNREQHTLTVSSQLQQLQRQKRFAGKLGRYIFGGHRRFGAASSNGLAERLLLCVVGLLGRHPKSRRVASLLACCLLTLLYQDSRFVRDRLNSTTIYKKVEAEETATATICPPRFTAARDRPRRQRPLRHPPRPPIGGNAVNG